jgi:hypothetical protein
MCGRLCPKRQGTLLSASPGREPTSHDIPPGMVPDRVRSPACAGGCGAAAAVVFFPGGAADELSAQRSRSRRWSGPVSTNWGTHIEQYYGYSWCSLGTATHYSYRV